MVSDVIEPQYDWLCFEEKCAIKKWFLCWAASVIFGAAALPSCWLSLFGVNYLLPPLPLHLHLLHIHTQYCIRLRENPLFAFHEMTSVYMNLYITNQRENGTVVLWKSKRLIITPAYIKTMVLWTIEKCEGDSQGSRNCGASSQADLIQNHFLQKHRFHKENFRKRMHFWWKTLFLAPFDPF